MSIDNYLQKIETSFKGDLYINQRLIAGLDFSAVFLPDGRNLTELFNQGYYRDTLIEHLTLRFFLDPENAHFFMSHLAASKEYTIDAFELIYMLFLTRFEQLKDENALDMLHNCLSNKLAIDFSKQYFNKILELFYLDRKSLIKYIIRRIKKPEKFFLLL